LFKRCIIAVNFIKTVNMITLSEELYIKKNAYIPEHLPCYVGTVSDNECFIVKDYVFYFGNRTLVFIGYPLSQIQADAYVIEIIEKLIQIFKPDYLALIGEEISYSKARCLSKETDAYWRVNLEELEISQKVRNMINRASRELYIEKTKNFGKDHLSIISQFYETHSVSEATKYIFERIPDYISSCETVFIFNAKDRNEKLIAFGIADFFADDYAFYMFNFSSKKTVPGVSDLILHEIIKTAKENNKKYINLGLGINEGVQFFKKKWGGVPFLKYEFYFYKTKKRFPSFLYNLFKRC